MTMRNLILCVLAATVCCHVWASEPDALDPERVIEEAAGDLGDLLPAYLQDAFLRDQTAWETSHERLCARKSGRAPCRVDAEKRAAYLIDGLLAWRYAKFGYAWYSDAERHRRGVETQLQSYPGQAAPPGEANDVCKSPPFSTALFGKDTLVVTDWQCRAQAAEQAADVLDARLGKLMGAGDRLATPACYTWVDGVARLGAHNRLTLLDGLTHTFGEICVVPQDTTTRISLRYYGYDSNSCGMDLVVRHQPGQAGENAVALENAFEGERCEINFDAGPNVLHLTVNDLEACSFAAWCGHRAELPTRIPIWTWTRTPLLEKQD